MPGRPFGPADAPAPADAYAALQARRPSEGLAAIAAGTALAPIVLRLPLVYGPGVGANFLALLDAVARRRVAAAGRRPRRSAACSTSAISPPPSTRCSTAPVAPSASTASPTRRRWRCRTSSARSPARWASRRGCSPVPVPLLVLAGRLAGRGDAIRRLVTALEVDASGFRAATGWVPAATLEEGLAATARWWRRRHALLRSGRSGDAAIIAGIHS